MLFDIIDNRFEHLNVNIEVNILKAQYLETLECVLSSPYFTFDNMLYPQNGCSMGLKHNVLSKIQVNVAVYYIFVDYIFSMDHKSQSYKLLEDFDGFCFYNTVHIRDLHKKYYNFFDFNILLINKLETVSIENQPGRKNI